jgi:SAM-dependent methyltransferase
MVTAPRLDAVLAALIQLSAVKVVTLFGSRARRANDDQSDIDLQVVTTKPEDFITSRWLGELPLRPVAYAHRAASGGVTKATVVFENGELDVVVLPFGRMVAAKTLVATGFHRRSRFVQDALQELARVLRPGYELLYGDKSWALFFGRIVAEIPEPRLSDEEVHRLGSCCFAEYVSLKRKILRGEIVASRRILHVHLLETNFRLLHESRIRTSLPTFRDARRVEMILPANQLESLQIGGSLDPSDLLRDAGSAVAMTYSLTRELTGRSPEWPMPF